MPDSPLQFSIQAKAPADHACLPGHFPGRPLVPATVLLDYTAQALRERLGALRLTAVHSAKFLLPVLPEQPIEILLAVDRSSGRASFRLRIEAGLAAHGELGFRCA